MVELERRGVTKLGKWEGYRVIGYTLDFGSPNWGFHFLISNFFFQNPLN